MKKLVLPKTINFALREELPKNEEHAAQWIKSAEANIVEGYQLSYPEGEQIFSFSAKVNIDNTRLWEVFKALGRSLPEPVCALYGWVESEVAFSSYTDYETLWAKVVPFEKYIVEDGYLQFGLLHNTETELVEVFVTESKYLQFWGNDLATFEEVMAQFDLSHIPDLEFIDEYPIVTHALMVLEPDALPTGNLVEMLGKELG